MLYLAADREYQKIWLELQALAWNRPELQAPVAHVNEEWRAVLTEAFAEPRERYGIEIGGGQQPVPVLAELHVDGRDAVVGEIAGHPVEALVHPDTSAWHRLKR